MATKCFPKPSLDATRQPPKNKDLTPTSPATKKHLPSVDKDIEPSKFDQEQRNNELEIVSGSELRSREDAQIRPFVQFFDQECYRMSGPLIDLYNDTKSFRVPWATKMSLDLLLEMCQKENNNNSKYKETTILQMVGSIFQGDKACLACQAGKNKPYRDCVATQCVRSGACANCIQRSMKQGMVQIFACDFFSKLRIDGTVKMYTNNDRKMILKRTDRHATAETRRATQG